MLQAEIIKTKDGSDTIWLPHLKETYHSKNGSIEEAYHVFITHGLGTLKQKDISVLEMGFGTGLNAFITYIESQKLKQTIAYTGVDLYPVDFMHISKLNYMDRLRASQTQQDVFIRMHGIAWGEKQALSDHFTLYKKKQNIMELSDRCLYDIVYYDAFSARVQPELWEKSAFQVIYNALKPSGVFVTYASKSSARRALQECGFVVEKLPGPTGRREMMRAYKS